MKTTTLDDIYGAYKDITDKGTLHTYVGVYGAMWDKLRGIVGSVLEIGVQRGGSLKMWRDYFYNATIHGIDVDDCPDVRGIDRITHHKVDVTNVGTVRPALDGKLFNIIIDDASHRIQDQTRTIATLWRYLMDGGWYVVEDVLRAEDMELFEPYGRSVELLDLAKTTGKYADRLVIIRK